MATAFTIFNVNDFAQWGHQGAAATIGPFELLGGTYELISTDNGGTNSTSLLQVNGMAIAAGDPSATVAVTPVIGSNPVTTGTAVFQLPPGQYEITTGASATSSSGSLTRVPHRNP